MIYLTPRNRINIYLTVCTPIFSILITIAIGSLIFKALGYNAVESLYYFFVAPISRLDQIADLFVKACPLIIIASGLVFCFRANIWNIGAEGQLILGAIFSGYIALSYPNLPMWVVMPAMIIFSLIGGFCWAFIPAMLKNYFRTNEILVSLMLTYVAILLLDWLVRGPWRSPMSYGFPLTRMYENSAVIPRVDLPGFGTLGQLHWGVVGALLVACFGYLLMNRMLIGFQTKVIGVAPKAANFAGFKSSKIVIFVMGISGALAGLAGMIEVSANIGRLQPDISFGYGFTAIIVVFLARLNPLAVIIAGLLVALAELGGDSAQIALGMPKVVTGVFKGILLFMLLAGETYNRFHIEMRLPKWGLKLVGKDTK